MAGIMIVPGQGTQEGLAHTQVDTSDVPVYDIESEDPGLQDGTFDLAGGVLAKALAAAAAGAGTLGLFNHLNKVKGGANEAVKMFKEGGSLAKAIKMPKVKTKDVMPKELKDLGINTKKDLNGFNSSSSLGAMDLERLQQVMSKGK